MEHSEMTKKNSFSQLKALEAFLDNLPSLASKKVAKKTDTKKPKNGLNKRKRAS